MKNIPTFRNFISEAEANISELPPDQEPMVTGIAQILRQVKDTENRMQIALDQIKQFKQQGISFDYNQFIKLCNL